MIPTIISPTTYDPAHYEGVCRLLGQLTTRSITFTPAHYEALVTSPCSHLFLMQCDDRIVGMLTIGVYLSPTGSKAWIEDVVVDTDVRGCGYGRMLVAHAMAFAEQQGIATLMLTSNPRRIAANALYRSLGFGRKETNMYKLELISKE